MKKLYTFYLVALIICMVCPGSNAAKVTVSVQNYQFSPASFTVNTGDTVMWMWDNGSHNTVSTDIPPGATSWNEPINQSSPTFPYVPAIAGSYDYVCTFHQSMAMTGHFTVLNATGINDVQAPTASLMINGVNPVKHELNLIYSIPKATELTIRMFDIIGNEVSTFVSATQNAGTYSQIFELPYLHNGIYLISLETHDAKRSKKIIIQ